MNFIKKEITNMANIERMDIVIHYAMGKMLAFIYKIQRSMIL